MTAQPIYKDATFYVQIQPIWAKWQKDDNDDPILQGAKVIALTQTRPNRARGVVVTKLTIRIPVGAFLPLRPEAVIVIPEGMAVAQPIEVIAEDPGQEP